MKETAKIKKGITRRDFLKGAAATSLALSLPSMSGRASAAQAPEQALVTAWDASNTVGFDFHKLSMKTQEKGVVNSCFNGLIEWDKSKVDPNLLKPGLAEAWDVSKDGTEWTFKLREGVRWHNNYGVDWGELTSEDCRFSLSRGKEIKGKESLEPILEIKAPDRYTLKVVLKRPLDPISVKMMLSNYHQGYIACKRAIETLGADYAFKPVGTGFMKLSQALPDTYSEWVAHETCWEGRPLLSRHRALYIKDLSSREMAFKKNEAQMIQGHLSQHWFERAAEFKDADPLVIGPGLIGVIHLNTSRKPFDDIRVRKAFMHSVDREALRKFIGKDITKPVVSVVPPDYLGSATDVERYEFNPDKCRQLLEKAGYPKGVQIEMQISEIDDYLRPMQVVQQMLKKGGIDLGLKVVTHSAYHKLTREDANPLVIYGCSRIPTGQQILNEFYHSKSIVGSPTAITNFSHYRGVDAELDAATREKDVEKQVRLWQSAQQKIMGDAVALPLYIYMQCWAKKKWVDLGYRFESNMEYSPLLSVKTRILPH